MSENSDFFFEFDSNVNFIMCVYILNIEAKKILIKNKTSYVIEILRRYHLNQISERNCHNCFQIMKVNLTFKISIKNNKFKKSKEKSTTFVNLLCCTFSIIMFKNLALNVFSITTLSYTNMRIQLFNKFMTYENDEIKNVYVELIREFFSL